MSRTYIHIGKALWNNSIQNEFKDRFEVKKYLLHCDRYNSEHGHFSNLRAKLREEIANKEMVQYKSPLMDMNEFDYYEDEIHANIENKIILDYNEKINDEQP